MTQRFAALIHCWIPLLASWWAKDETGSDIACHQVRASANQRIKAKSLFTHINSWLRNAVPHM